MFEEYQVDMKFDWRVTEVRNSTQTEAQTVDRLRMLDQKADGDEGQDADDDEPVGVMKVSQIKFQLEWSNPELVS